MKSTIIPVLMALASSALVVPMGRSGAFFTNETGIIKRAPLDSKYCVQVQSTISTWYYSFTGIWGFDSGQGPSAIGSFCVNTDDNAGGAMYFGPDPNPGPGSTKFECFFPGSSNTANCDVSLVDGYSLSMQCSADGQPNTIGGGVDLYQTGIACPDQQGQNCRNDNGPSAGSQDEIDQFFQPAVKDGNNYCIFHNCSQDYSFDVSAGITCTVFGQGH